MLLLLPRTTPRRWRCRRVRLSNNESNVRTYPVAIPCVHSNYLPKIFLLHGSRLLRPISQKYKSAREAFECIDVVCNIVVTDSSDFSCVNVDTVGRTVAIMKLFGGDCARGSHVMYGTLGRTRVRRRAMTSDISNSFY
jgi:hypothetical protein